MKVRILFPGRIKPKALSAAQDEYVRRLKAFGVEIAEYKDEKVSTQTPERTKEVEAERILKHLKIGDYLIACDERGRKITTLEFSDALRAARQGAGAFAGKRRIVIVIGGALGLSESIRHRADAVWSLSSMVMAGGVARVVLLEGIYRAFTVVENHPYHNE